MTYLRPRARGAARCRLGVNNRRSGGRPCPTLQPLSCFTMHAARASWSTQPGAEIVRAVGAARALLVVGDARAQRPVRLVGQRQHEHIRALRRAHQVVPQLLVLVGARGLPGRVAVGRVAVVEEALRGARRCRVGRVGLGHLEHRREAAGCLAGRAAAPGGACTPAPHALRCAGGVPGDRDGGRCTPSAQRPVARVHSRRARARAHCGAQAQACPVRARHVRALSSGVQPVDENLTSFSVSGSWVTAPALSTRISLIVSQSDPALRARPRPLLK